MYSEADLRARDPLLQPLTPADRKLIAVYGDTIHHNDGTHLSGSVSVAVDGAWQRRWKAVVAGPISMYHLPKKGRWAPRFLTLLTAEFRGARERQWNSERPLCFPALILHRKRGVKLGAKEIKATLTSRMDAWEAGRFDALAQEVADQWQRGDGRRSSPPTTDDQWAEANGRRYQGKIHDGKLRAAVRMVTDRNGGKFYLPTDKDSKTGRPVLEVLREKHPETAVPAEDDFDVYVEDAPEPLPFECYEEDVARKASSLTGGAGPDGTDSQTAKHWLQRFGVYSEALREEMALWVTLLANGSPEYAMYRAANSANMAAKDKEPGVRPLAPGTIWMRLWGRCQLDDDVRLLARDACGNQQTGAGLRAGIEGCVHALHAAWPESAGWFNDRGIGAPPIPPQPNPAGPTDPPAPPLTQEGMEEDEEDSADDDQPEEGAEDDAPPAHASQSSQEVAAQASAFDRYVAGTGFGALLIDARNAFNEIKRYLLLWQLYHRWRRGSRFAFNRYRHHIVTYVRGRPGEAPITLLSREGIAQGCTHGMCAYCVALMPLIERLNAAVPEALLPGYADDYTSAGQAQANVSALRFLVENGERYGYYPEPSKSVYVCKGEDEDEARRCFAAAGITTVKFRRGHRYLGSYVGSGDQKVEYVEEKVRDWIGCVKVLAAMAKKYPQAVYTGYSLCLQAEWQYLCRVTPDIAHLLEPLEAVIRKELLPAFLGVGEADITNKFREQLGVAVRRGGFGIGNPMEAATKNYDASTDASEYFVETLAGRLPFDQTAHWTKVAQAKESARLDRSLRDGITMERLGRGRPAVKRRTQKALEGTGRFLTAIPHVLNGTILSADEWRDNARLLFNLEPLDLPALCDGCGSRFSVDHALSCKQGGLVHVRHEDIASEWRWLASCAFSPSHVEREPYIESSAGRRAREAAAAAQGPDPATTRAPNPPPTPPPTPATPAGATTPVPDEKRGDVGIFGLWTRGRQAILDVRVTDTDARSYRHKAPARVLAEQEREKKDKYHARCQELRKDFTPLIYSVDGMAGREAIAAEKAIALALSRKWGRPYPMMCQYVRMRLRIALARNNTLLLRGSRDREPPRPFIESGTALYQRQSWGER